MHLVRRALGSFSNAPPTAEERSVAVAVLREAELTLWDTMQGRDRRHSLVVLARFDQLAPGAPREARAAALLHDIGKASVSLGWLGRIAATILGPRASRFDRYLRHEEIGAAMLEGVSEPLTVSLVTSHDETDPLAIALRRADEI